MTWIDWSILILFFAFTIWDGLRQSGSRQSVEGLLLANRSMPWWAIGISVMATQASAISFIATTGFAYMHDMSFLQMYLGLPIAMVILCITLVPFFHKAKIFTAYEALEKRFGLKVRLTTSMLFLLSRGLAMGTVIAAPAYVLALILNVPLYITILLTGIVVTTYTFFGGITGVIRTDIKQLTIMMAGLIFCFFYIIYKLPEDVGFTDGLHLAGALGKLNILDFEFDVSNKYTIWSGLIAGVFLFLSYFGSDQTQVQRYLTAKSLDHAKGSLILSAFAKIPMMFAMLLIGVMIYVFFIFQPAPLLFIPENDQTVITQGANQQEFSAALTDRKEKAYKYLGERSNSENRADFVESDNRCNFYRQQQVVSLKRQDGQVRNDTNYVLPHFVLSQLPTGIVGLIIAAIFAAAFSSMDSGLNSLAASTTVDWYQRLNPAKTESDHYKFTKLATLFWGVFATLGALLIGETRSLIELVNLIGSYFYGSILGVFVVYFIKRINALGALIGLISGIVTVFLVDSIYHNPGNSEILFFLPELFQTAFGQQCPAGYIKSVSYLWLNPVGTITVVVISTFVSVLKPGAAKF